MKHEILTQFERDALNFVLQGDLEVLSLLRHQATRITSLSRWYSGVGFAHKFDLEKKGLRRTSSISGVKENFQITDGIAYLNNEINFVAAYLFVRGGYIDWLECVTISSGYWPDKIDNYRFSYLSEDGERYWNWLIEQWEKDK